MRIKNYCIDCGIEISRNSTRCAKCAGKIHSKKMAGSKSHFYKHGKCCEKVYCIECGKLLSKRAFYYGNKRCKSCITKEKYRLGILTGLGRKGKKASVETKRKNSLSHGGTGIPHENDEYPQEFNDELKEQIRARDNYTCQLTGITEEEHLIIHGQVLNVHHIDYNKENCVESNLITLSRESNKRVNYHREYWKKYFKRKRKEQRCLLIQ